MHTHWTSAVCLILSVWVPSASFCSLLHSAVLAFSTAALTLCHYYAIHPLPLPHFSLSITCKLRLLFSRPSTFLYHFLFLQYNFSILSVTCPFSSTTSSIALIFFFLLHCCHTFPPSTHTAFFLLSSSAKISPNYLRMLGTVRQQRRHLRAAERGTGSDTISQIDWST